MCVYVCVWFFEGVHGSIENELILNRSVKLRDGALTGTTTAGKSRPGSNDNNTLLQTPHITRTGGSLSNGVYYHTQVTSFWWIFTLLQNSRQCSLSLSDSVECLRGYAWTCMYMCACARVCMRSKSTKNATMVLYNTICQIVGWSK